MELRGLRADTAGIVCLWGACLGAGAPGQKVRFQPESEVCITLPSCTLVSRRQEPRGPTATDRMGLRRAVEDRQQEGCWKVSGPRDSGKEGIC